MRNFTARIFLLMLHLLLYMVELPGKSMSLNQILKNELYTNSYDKTSLMHRFYSSNHYHYIWSQNNVLNNEAIKFIDVLENCYLDGLNPNDYYINEIDSIINDDNTIAENKIAVLDLLLTDAFFKYVQNITQGVINTKDFYPDWDIKKTKIDSLNILNQYINMNYNLNDLIPTNLNYQRLKEKLLLYYDILDKYQELPYIADETHISKLSYNSNVLAIATRLELTDGYHITPKNIFGYFDQNLKKAVKSFQLNHDLKADGVIGFNTVSEFNKPLISIIKKISLNMDRLRWMSNYNDANVIIVNIPDFSLKVIENNNVIIQMPVIVGSNRSLQSCVLTSEIKSINLNPYWYIPNSIVKNDIIPKLRDNQDYLYKNNIKVYKITDKSNSLVSINDIDLTNTEDLVTNYRFIQDSGEKNSLGRIKFVFDNKCGIYLHDTSSPSLFKTVERNLSHGCIRIKDPITLAAYLLEKSPLWTKEKIIDSISTNLTKFIKLENPVKIEIIYLTSWVDDNDQLQFRNDIYSYDDIPFTPYVFEQDDE